MQASLPALSDIRILSASGRASKRGSVIHRPNCLIHKTGGARGRCRSNLTECRPSRPRKYRGDRGHRYAPPVLWSLSRNARRRRSLARVSLFIQNGPQSILISLARGRVDFSGATFMRFLSDAVYFFLHVYYAPTCRASFSFSALLDCDR